MKLIIEVDAGTVTAVYADSADMEIDIFDRDALEGNKEEGRREKEIDEQMASGELKQVY